MKGLGLLSLTVCLGIEPAAGPPRWEVVGDAGLRGSAPLVEQATSFLRDELARVRDILGLEASGLPIRWVLEVSAPRDGTAAGRDPAGDSPAYFEAGRTRFTEAKGPRAVGVEATVMARRHLRRPEGLRALVAHEVAHATLASSCGPEPYRKLPWWFREGIALWFSREGELRVGEMAAYAAFQERAASSFLVGLKPGTGPREGATPAEAYLAISWLESQVGPQGLRRICADLKGARPFEDALRDLAGKGQEEAGIAALRFSRHRIAEVLPREREERFLGSMRSRRLGDLQAAVAAWKALLDEDPRGPLAATLHYLLGKELSAGSASPKRRREGRSHLEALLGMPTALWRPEALVLLGEHLRDEGRIEEARALWLEVLEGFPEDRASADRAKRHLEASPRRTGE